MKSRESGAALGHAGEGGGAAHDWRGAFPLPRPLPASRMRRAPPGCVRVPPGACVTRARRC